MSHKISSETYRQRFYENTQNLTLLSDYVNAKTKVLVKCNIDSYEWSVIPSSPIRGIGCPLCSGTLKITHEEFIRRMKDINPNIIILSNYINSKSKVVCKCAIDKFQWESKPNDLLNGHGCPKCAKESYGEKCISNWLDCSDIAYITQYRFDDCKDHRTLPFDFYLDDINACIEYQGQQHYKPVDFAGKGDKWATEQFKLVQKRDKIKSDYCKSHNIPLLTIPYWDFDNIEIILDDFIKELNIRKKS